jgi:hypothetical protein
MDSRPKQCETKALHLVIDEYQAYRKASGALYSKDQIEKLIKKHCGE